MNETGLVYVYLTLPVSRKKGTPPKKGGGPVLLLRNYPHPLSAVITVSAVQSSTCTLLTIIFSP